MSYFVTITFDLEYAAMSRHGTNVYAMIADELDDLDFSRFVKGKKKRATQLPSNTYVAEFDDDGERASKIIEFIQGELKRILEAYSVSGKYFVAAGRGWAWKLGRVKR